jgi:hypothetical protein
LDSGRPSDGGRIVLSRSTSAAFSAAEARRQLDMAIDWGFYAPLFGFDDETDELFIKTAE